MGKILISFAWFMTIIFVVFFAWFMIILLGFFAWFMTIIFNFGSNIFVNRPKQFFEYALKKHENADS